jgi:hypothetical protein
MKDGSSLSQSGMALVRKYNHEREPFASIPKLLPEVKNLKARLSVSIERRMLADEMEAALAKSQRHAQPPTTEGPPTAAPSKPPPSIPRLPPSGTPQPKSPNSKQLLGSAEDQHDSGSLWMIGVSVAAVGILWWLGKKGSQQLRSR